MASLSRASLVLATGTATSRVLGFVKAIVLAQAIGVVGSVSADAYATATIVPNSIYAIIAQGVLNAVLVPQIVRASTAPDGGRAYINKLVTIAVLVFGGIALAATVASPALMWFYGVGADHVKLATAFAFWSLPQIFFLGLYTVLGEVLNARKSFGPFTWAPAANNVVGIAAIGIFIALFGSDASGQRISEDWSPTMIAVLAGGATLGIAVQALMLFAFWKRIGLRFSFDFAWRGVNLGTAGRAAAWSFAMVITTQIAGWVETRTANTVSGEGASVFAMHNAWLIFMLPHSIVTVSIATAYYTTLSEHAHAGDRESFRGDLSQSARAVGLIVVLAQAVLLVVAFPFAAVFATSGFDSVSQLAPVIIAYAIALVPFSLLALAQRAFYALGDTRTPFFYTLAQAALVVAGVLGCLALPPQWRAVGIATVVSIGCVLQCIAAWMLLRRKVSRIDGRRILASLARFVGAAMPALALGTGALWLLGGLTEGGFAVSSRLSAIAGMLVIGTVMALAYLGTLRLLRAPELDAVVAPLLRRITRRP